MMYSKKSGDIYDQSPIVSPETTFGVEINAVSTVTVKRFLLPILFDIK